MLINPINPTKYINNLFIMQSYFNDKKNISTKIIEISKSYISMCTELKHIIVFKSIDIKLDDKNSIKIDLERCTELQSIIDAMHSFNYIVEEFNEAVSAAKDGVNNKEHLLGYIDSLSQSQRSTYKMMEESDGYDNLLREIEGWHIT